MKICPYCAEEIQDQAIFCKHCHHDLSGRVGRWWWLVGIFCPLASFIAGLVYIDRPTTRKGGLGLMLISIGMTVSYTYFAIQREVNHHLADWLAVTQPTAVQTFANQTVASVWTGPTQTAYAEIEATKSARLLTARPLLTGTVVTRQTENVVTGNQATIEAANATMWVQRTQAIMERLAATQIPNN